MSSVADEPRDDVKLIEIDQGQLQRHVGEVVRATVEETLNQVTDRLEKKLQETPGLDFIRSSTSAGRAVVFVNLLDSTPSEDVPDVWYQVRKKMDDIRGTFPAGVVGPAFNDEFGDTYGIIYAFTADGFSPRQLRDHVERVRAVRARLSVRSREADRDVALPGGLYRFRLLPDNGWARVRTFQADILLQNQMDVRWL